MRDENNGCTWFESSSILRLASKETWSKRLLYELFVGLFDDELILDLLLFCYFKIFKLKFDSFYIYVYTFEWIRRHFLFVVFVVESSFSLRDSSHYCLFVAIVVVVGLGTFLLRRRFVYRCCYCYSLHRHHRHFYH